MQKSVYLFLCSLIILLSNCTQKDTKQDVLSKIKEIDRLHTIAKNNINDSTLIYIARAEKIIHNNKNLPDTLYIENIFRKGYYYEQTKQLDSASYYFHEVINLIKLPRKRNITYFRRAWEVDFFNKRYANAVNIAEKFINVSDENQYAGDL